MGKKTTTGVRTRTPKLALGDVLAIPVGKRFALARVWESTWIAVCEGFVGRPRLPRQRELDKVAFYAAVVDAQQSGWQVLGNIPFADVADSIPPPTFTRDILKPSQYFILHRDGRMKRSSKKGVKGLEPARVYFPREVVERLLMRLERRWDEERVRFKEYDIGL